MQLLEKNMRRNARWLAAVRTVNPVDVLSSVFFFSSRIRHTRWNCDWSSDVCSSDLLHGVTGEFFGYPGDRPRAGNWPDGYAAMLEALLADAVDWGVPLPVEPDALRGLVTRHRGVLAAVTTPVLLHFDLWDGNVLTTVEDGRAQLS